MMNGSQLWLCAAALQALLLTVHCGHHRRTMATQATLPVSKGGWRPVVGSNGLIYNSYNTAPLHSPSYKIPVPVLDMYQSSSRPIAARDGTKLTSIAQSYRPTTLRSAPASPPAPLQPINSYHNPFQFQNNGLQQNGLILNNGQSYYKHVQNYPVDSVLIRNPHNPYAARPVFTNQKYSNKYKQQQLQNSVLQQLTSIQPIQFGQYQTSKPLDIFGKPVESYARPTENKQQQHSSGGTEIYKQELYKLPDSDTASQQLSKVKTAQQQTLSAQAPVYTFPQYTFQDPIYPSSILGSFGSFGLQSLKARDPIFPTKSTFLPQPATKQTIFNSFGYSPNFKTTPTVYSTTTPRVLTTSNQYSSTYSNDNVKITPTPSTKVSTPPKIDPNADVKDGFKPSPKDPFQKYYQSDYNKVIPTTYNPLHTTPNNVYEYSYQAQNAQQQSHYNKNNLNYDYDKKHQHDSLPAGNQQQFINSPNEDADAALHAPIKPTYEVTESVDSDVITHSASPSWSLTSQPNEYNQKDNEDTPKDHEYNDYGRPHTPPYNLADEYALVTESERGNENYNHHAQYESQSQLPPGDDFEPNGPNKLKDYYSYKVSTPSYDDYSVTRRTKRPTESPKTSTQSATTTVSSTEVPLDTLPTLPPSQFYKRPPSTTEMTPSVDKDKIRKRTKIRRRRPPLANINRNRDESSTRGPNSETTQNDDEVHTIKPRVRPTSSTRAQTQSTTPSVSTDLTTSAIPTISPTFPSIIKKKLIHRRPSTTTPADKVETTTISSFKVYEASKESPIMKIANRHQSSKTTSNPYDYKSSETPDYTHKQDEKDTPTSDVSVNIDDSYRTTVDSDQEFVFHKDMKPIEAKLEAVTSRYRETTTEGDISNEVTTFAPRESSNIGKIQRPRLRNKYNRPKFSVKDYKSRLSSTTTTERSVENTPKLKFPLRRNPYTETTVAETETTTERKKFTPKEPRYKTNVESETERETTYSVRQSSRQKQTTPEIESTTKMSSRIRNGNRRTKPTEESTEALAVTTRRPLRKKIKDSEIGESVQDVSVTETTVYDFKDQTSERTRSESAIMKIADKKHHDPIEHLFEHSKRVSDLTLAASKDYNKPGMFKSVSSNSRRIPNYFTIATDDPILPIEAFFPQLNQKKET